MFKNPEKFKTHFKIKGTTKGKKHDLNIDFPLVEIFVYFMILIKDAVETYFDDTNL